MLHATYVYSSSQRELEEQWRAGLIPDTALHGRPYLAEHGIAASWASAPGAALAHRLPPPLRQAVWHGRIVVPVWRARRSDVLFTYLGLAPGLFRSALPRRPASRLVLFAVNWQTAVFRHSGVTARAWRRAIEAADAVVCLAEAQRDGLLAAGGARAERMHVVRFGGDSDYFSPARRESESASRPLVVAVGRDGGRDYATFMAAVDGLEVDALVVAAPRNLAGIERVPPNVEVRLGLTFEALRDVYARATAVVVSVHPDGYPHGSDCSGQTVLLDAMAMGCPVVISERAWVHEYVRDGETALVVPPREPAALRSAIEKLVHDDGAARELGGRGRAVLEAELTSRDFAAGLARVFEAVARGS